MPRSFAVKILGALAIVLCPLGLRAQSSFTIPVQNQNGLAITGATVALTCTDTTNGCTGKGPFTVFSSGGNANFTAIPAGNYTVTVSGPGITTYSYAYTVGSQPNGGTASPSSIDSIIFVDGVTYPCTSVGINNAIAAVIAKGGGRVDTNACPTLSSYTTEIDVGNSSGVPVALFLPQGNSGGTPSWNANITDGVSYALKVFNNSAAIGYTTTYGSFFIAAGSSANMAAVCGNAAAVANEHIRMEGFSCGVYGGSPTIVKAIGYFHGTADTAVARNMTFEDFSATATVSKIFWVWNACCAGTFEYVTAEASGISGITPCYFGNGNITNGANLATGFDHIACVHPGSGASNVQDDEWAQYTGSLYSNIYMETVAGADTTTPWINITANSSPTAADTFVGVTAGGDVASSTRYLFKIASGAKANIFSAKQGGVSTNAVQDLNSGLTIGRPINSSFSYSTEPSWSVTPTLSNVQSISLPNSLLIASTAPAISTHFNTSGDSIVANGTASFTITVGIGTGTSTGAISLPTSTTGWNCWLTNQNRADLIQQTGSSTASATFTNFSTTFSATNWTNSDVLRGGCAAN